VPGPCWDGDVCVAIPSDRQRKVIPADELPQGARRWTRLDLDGFAAREELPEQPCERTCELLDDAVPLYAAHHDSASIGFLIVDLGRAKLSGHKGVREETGHLR